MSYELGLSAFPQADCAYALLQFLLMTELGFGPFPQGPALQGSAVYYRNRLRRRYKGRVRNYNRVPAFSKRQNEVLGCDAEGKMPGLKRSEPRH